METSSKRSTKEVTEDCLESLILFGTGTTSGAFGYDLYLNSNQVFENVMTYLPNAVPLWYLTAISLPVIAAFGFVGAVKAGFHCMRGGYRN
jgi:hypothetical protein